MGEFKTAKAATMEEENKLTTGFLPSALRRRWLVKQMVLTVFWTKLIIRTKKWPDKELMVYLWGPIPNVGEKLTYIELIGEVSCLYREVQREK